MALLLVLGLRGEAPAHANSESLHKCALAVKKRRGSRDQSYHHCRSQAALSLVATQQTSVDIPYLQQQQKIFGFVSLLVNNSLNKFA
ncbi:MAG: hypothetical protein FWC38_03145 [Proteobacteria bacterium]|nr:hypothetical protein [Pseudomonadota bacterium]